MEEPLYPCFPMRDLPVVEALFECSWKLKVKRFVWSWEFPGFEVERTHHEK